MRHAVSTDNFPRGQAAVVSAATFGLGAAPGYSSMELAVQAALKALANVGLTPGDVDGLMICLPDDIFSSLSLAEYLGINPRITDTTAPAAHRSRPTAPWQVWRWPRDSAT